MKLWDKKGHTKLYSDILTLHIISRQIKKNSVLANIFLEIRKYYYLNESYQVSCLSDNVNINVFGIFMCLTQLQTSFYNI